MPTAHTILTGQVLLLLDHLDRLKALHRAGEAPTFGQVEALFDQASVVRTALTACPHQRAAWPTPSSTATVEDLARRLVARIASVVQESAAS